MMGKGGREDYEKGMRKGDGGRREEERNGYYRV